MSNMSYCRFANTLADLKDCVAALDEGEDVSPEEHRALTELIVECREVGENYDADFIDIDE